MYQGRIFLLIITLALIQIQGEFVNWYPSSPSIKINQKDICPQSSGVYLTQCLYRPFQSCCILFSYECGLSIICFESQSQKIMDLKLNIQVQDMLIQPQSSYLWIADPNYIFLYEISALNQTCCFLILKSKVQKQFLSGDTITLQYFSTINGRLFVSNTNGVYIYDVTTPTQPIFVSKITVNQRAQRIKIATQINTIFLVDGNYQILKITNPEDIYNPSKPINTLQQCEFPFPFVMLNEIVDNKYLIVQSINSIVAGVDLTLFLTSGKCNDLYFKNLFSNGDTYSFVYMTPDSKYVILSLINVSLQVIEISYEPILMAKLFQIIRFNGYLYYFKVSQDQSFILISNQYTIDIFQRKEKPNYNLVNPSILNIPQMIINQETVVSSTHPLSYGCQYAPINNYLIHTKEVEGTQIIQEDKDNHFLFIQKAINPPNFSSSLGMSKVFNNERTIIISRDSWIFIYNISNISNPVQLSSVNLEFQGIQIHQAYITKNMQYALLASGLKGILIIDISDLINPRLINSIHNNLSIPSACYCVTMNQNEKYAIASYTLQGLIIYDFSDFSNPIILSYFTTNNGYSHIFMQNEDYLVQLDLINGITIVDVSDIRNPVEYSGIHIDASSKECVLINGDQFMLCTSNSLGQLRLIDLRDLKNPYILQKYDYQDYKGGDFLCLNNNQNIIYLGLQSAIVRINLFPNFQFEIDLLLLRSGQNDKNEFLDITQTLKIGMKVKVTIVQVYPARKAIITGAKFYSDYKIQNLPFWAFFSVTDSSLTIEFNKNSLSNGIKINQDTNGYITYSFQFIFTINQQIVSTDFVNNDLNIDQTLSNQIFIDCIQSNLLDRNYYFVETTFEIINYLLYTKYSANLIQYIFYVLSRKNIYYPILLKVQNSLDVQIGEKNNVPQITSTNNDLQIELNVNKQQAQFIPYYYNGVLTYFSDNRDWMKIEGDLNSINIIIKRGFYLVNFINPEDISIQISVDDTVNEIVRKNIKASQQPIIKLNQKIMNSSNLTLQEDFNNKFEGGSVYIQDAISYTINSLVFVNPDNRPIKYEAFLLSEGKQIQIPQQYWLIFQNEERTFIGTTKSNQYGQTIRILVNATDGYSYAIDYLQFTIDKVPIQYVLVLIFQIASPLIGLLGLWKYKSFLYNHFMKKNFETTPIVIVQGQEIIIQIPMLGNKLFIAQKLWSEFYSCLNKNEIIREFNSLNQIFSSNQTPKAENTIESLAIKKIELFQNSEGKMEQSTKSKNFLKYQKQFLKIYTKEQLKKQASRQISFSQEQLQKSGDQQKIQLKYFNTDNSLNISNLLQGVIEFYKQTSKHANKKMIDQLSNPLSMYSRAISGLAYISFSQLLDKAIDEVIKYLKFVAMKEGFKEIDWYKHYIFILPQCNKIHIDQFPSITIDEDKLLRDLETLISSLGQQQQVKQYKIKIPLIKEVIKAIALGFTFEKRGIISKIRGECIETKHHNIQSIKTFIPILNKSCCKRRKKEVLVAKEFSSLQETPTWVKSVDIVNCVILIKGKTEHKDIGEYVLNIYNNQNFIMKQIRITITDHQKVDNELKLMPQPSDRNLTSDYTKFALLKYDKKLSFGNNKFTEEDVPLESGLIEDKYFEKQSYLQKFKQGQLTELQGNNLPSYIKLQQKQRNINIQE